MSLFGSTIDAVFCMLKNWFCWMLTTALYWCQSALDVAFNVLGAVPTIDLSGLKPSLAVIDLWFPLTESVGMMIGWVSWICVWFAVRTIKNSIPTMA